MLLKLTEEMIPESHDPLQNPEPTSYHCILIQLKCS